MSVGTQRRLRGEKKERRKVRWNKANGRNGKVSFFNLALWTGFEPRKSKRVDSKDKTPFQQTVKLCAQALLHWDLQTKSGAELGVGNGSSSASLLWVLEDCCSDSTRDSIPGTTAVSLKDPTAGIVMRFHIRVGWRGWTSQEGCRTIIFTSWIHVMFHSRAPRYT